MMFTEEKIRRLEKRIERLERANNKNFQQVELAFSAFREVLLKMQVDNEALRKDRDFLLQQYKMELKKIPAPSLREDIKKTLVDETGKKVKENFDLLRAVASEGLVEPRMDELFEIVFMNGKIKSSDAARQMNVHERQVEEWAKLLEARSLIEVQPFKGQLVLRKRA